jgi:hypothetical protein
MIIAPQQMFCTDHPLDLGDKYLYHTSIESSERMEDVFS